MTTLPVKWVYPEWIDSQNKKGKVPVIEVADLDALREGLEKIYATSNSPMYTAAAARLAAQQEAQRLLALLPTKEGA